MPRKTAYLVGPLARINMSHHQLAPTARREAESCGVKWPSGNIFHSIVARAIELIHASEEAIAIIDQYERTLPISRVDVSVKPGRACYAAEVPGGLTYQRYRVGSNGLIADAKIVSPEAQNQKQAEQDLRAFLPRLGQCESTEATRRCEQLVRNYDPGLGGSTFVVNERSMR
jgi:coenzyme F420-reducing hydrogenase alpha subunit